MALILTPARPPCLSVLGIWFLAATVQAHHSYADFDAARTVTLAGTVEAYAWANPHVSFTMTVTSSGSAPEEWNIETHGPAILTHDGWSAGTLKAGMPIRVVCNPKRDGSHGCRLHTVLLVSTGRTLETKLSRSTRPTAPD